MPKVSSTAIERVRVGLGDKFTVKFHSGGTYEVEAPRSVYRDLRFARSVGAHYNHHIKGKYPTRKVDA